MKDQFESNLVEESVDAVRGGGSSSNSPSASSPESPYIAPVARQDLAGIWRCYCHLMDEINNVTTSLGKDGKFQLFMCLSLRYEFQFFFLVE